MCAGKIIWRPACCLLMFFPLSIIHLLALLNAGHVSVLILTISYIWHLSALAYGDSDLWYNSSSEPGPNFKKGFSCKRCTNGVCILHSCSILTCSTSNLSESLKFRNLLADQFFFLKSPVRVNSCPKDLRGRTTSTRLLHKKSSVIFLIGTFFTTRRGWSLEVKMKGESGNFSFDQQRGRFYWLD